MISNVKTFLCLIASFCMGIMVGSEQRWKSDFFDTSSFRRTLISPSVEDWTGSMDRTILQRRYNGRIIQNKNHQDEWHSINVYTGPQFNTPPSSQRFFSQARQDECVLSLLKNHTGGYFIDLASNDAMLLSNTYSLETSYNWTGLCIEPNPIYWYNLTHYRPHCTLVGAVLGNETGQLVNFLYAGNEHGGIVGETFDNKRPALKDKSIQHYTVTLLDVFQRYNVPNVIDYLSLDVEGAEEYILGGFNFNEYQFKILSIERPKDGLRKLLETNKYRQIQRLSRWGETLWVHTHWESSLELSQLDEFSGKRQWEEQKRREQEVEELSRTQETVRM